MSKVKIDVVFVTEGVGVWECVSVSNKQAVEMKELEHCAAALVSLNSTKSR